MKNSLQTGSFSSKNKNKSFSNIPELEGFSNGNINSKLYQDVYQFLNNNIDYEECKKKTDENCNEYKFYQVDNVQNELNEIKKETEKAKEECDSFLKKIKDLETLITTYEEEIKKLEEEAKKLFC